jgi:hypothetical protein
MTADILDLRGAVATARLHLARVDAAALQGDHKTTGEAIAAAQEALLEARVIWGKMPFTAAEEVALAAKAVGAC